MKIEFVVKRSTVVLVGVSVLVLIALMSFIHIVIRSPSVQPEVPKVVREPIVAGQFYPIDGLEEMITEYLNNAEEKNLPNIRGLVAPHAGYIFSGQVAAQGFRQIDKRIKTAIVIGPSHHSYFIGASIANVTHYRTPLGDIKLSDKVKELRNEDLIVSRESAHDQEHSVEVELPFLQKGLGSFEVIPMVAGDVDPEKLADVLIKYIDDETLVVASSDLSHYYPYDMAVQLDKICTDAIPNLDFYGMGDCQACGKIPVLTLMHIAEKLGWSGSLIDYKNSGDTAGNKGSVVGYASIAFYEGLNENEQEFLLQLARQTLESYLGGEGVQEVDESLLSENLLKTQGCFVTLNEHGQLRGCIGHIIPQEALYKCVMDNAISAALYDRRFLPVVHDELKDIKIEISVLSIPKRLKYESADELLSLLTPLKDGVVIKSGVGQSTYLPQVWESLPEKEGFLSSLCIKGGSPSDCWKDKNTIIETYQAHVFGEG